MLRVSHSAFCIILWVTSSSNQHKLMRNSKRLQAVGKYMLLVRCHQTILLPPRSGQIMFDIPSHTPTAFVHNVLTISMPSNGVQIEQCPIVESVVPNYISLPNLHPAKTVHTGYRIPDCGPRQSHSHCTTLLGKHPIEFMFSTLLLHT